jgi:hypothetical protein
MMKHLLKLSVLAMGLSLCLAPRFVLAGHGDDDEQGEHEEHHKDKHDKHDKHHGKGEAEVEYHGVYFNRERVVVIHDYYTPEEFGHLPPGVRKHLERTGHLPPGWEKKVVVHEVLPPEYVEELVPAPPALLVRVGPLPPESALYLSHGDAILLDRKTHAIMDIVHGAVELTGR